MEPETHKDIITKDNQALKGIYNTYVRLSYKDKLLTSYIIEKTSRVTAAILLLTARNKGQDKLLTQIEESAVRLVLHASRAHESDTERGQFLVEIGTLAVLLDVGGRTARMSQSNAELLSDELLAFQRYVGEIEWNSGRRFMGGEQLFVHKPSLLDLKDNAYRADISTQGQTKDTGAPQPHQKETSSYGTQGQIQRDIRQSPIRHNTERMQDAQKDRRATILGMLQRKDRVSVRDVANVIKDCSEKTLQRELLALVAQGVLVKDGERRWSTYRLA